MKERIYDTSGYLSKGHGRMKLIRHSVGR